MSHNGNEHYYSQVISTPSARQKIIADLRGVQLRLITDAGVFSKGRVDAGTRLLVESMPLPQRGRVLDLGCGYGPIGILVAKLCPECHVYMIEPNQRAVGLAKENAVMNGVTNVTIIPGKGFQPIDESIKFDAIVTNPPYRAGKDVVYDLVTQSANRLNTDGTFTCVGQSKQGVKSLRSFVEKVFGNVEEIAKSGGYRVLHARQIMLA